MGALFSCENPGVQVLADPGLRLLHTKNVCKKFLLGRYIKKMV